MDTNDELKTVINNEYDYSNILVTADGLAYLVQYCNAMNEQLDKLVLADEEKNKQLKYEFKEFMYKKAYSQQFEIYIREKNSNNITLKDYNSFIDAVKGGYLNRISSMEIKLYLNFRRGRGENLEDHENEFKMIFEPYDIKFIRKSNYKDNNMDKVEEQINNIFKQFSIANSVFCNKNN